MSKWNMIDPETLESNTFHLIGKEWMLVTAGTENKVNTMTASWGGLGIMWAKNVAFVVIRPQRYTKEFIDTNDTFSLTFFNEGFKKELGYLGSISGRDEDKIAKANLTVTHMNGTPCFEEGKLVLICKKLFAQVLSADSFIDKSLIDNYYPNEDFHTLYIVEVQNAYKKES
ncbi:flavin reductase [Anaeromicropila populeti]|uniref:NADH-FMN oxidoreductase RutF, flavin reductase (DIM6/NTAB) family n=1 Tax=Anaeromicropila populeti TaxID=37658 RepID=A0A1I6JSQ8_9FIRM|nr:flavin reductase [Anaeromicropila populeti]SFR81973.1 NADH-FMN oxidoreductase RutF, flavin reductase (DIM6/NTAB) family [Anaeromicropila populeti]